MNHEIIETIEENFYLIPSIFVLIVGVCGSKVFCDAIYHILALQEGINLEKHALKEFQIIFQKKEGMLRRVNCKHPKRASSKLIDHVLSACDNQISGILSLNEDVHYGYSNKGNVYIESKQYNIGLSYYKHGKCYRFEFKVTPITDQPRFSSPLLPKVLSRRVNNH